MARIDHRVGRQMGNYRLETLYEISPRAQLKVGSSYTHAEERITGKRHFLGFTVEKDTTRRMSWGVKHLQLMRAETDDVAIGE